MVTNESQETLEQSGWTFQSEEIPDAPTGGGGGLVLPLLFTTNSDNEPTSFTLDADNPTLQPLLDALATAEVGAKLPVSVTLYNTTGDGANVASVETQFTCAVEYQGAKVCLVQFLYRSADTNEAIENVWAVTAMLGFAEGQVDFQHEEPKKLSGSTLVLKIRHDDVYDTLTLDNIENAKEILTQLWYEWNRGNKSSLIIRTNVTHSSNVKMFFDLPIVRINKPSGSVLEVRGAFPDVNLDGGADAQDEMFSQSPFGILIRATWNGAISVVNCTIEQFPLYPVFG
ncbi:MAG: hypothetical protein IKB68_06365 [Rikenellaceae bacterium]|nr:hypothetical protein [Rikenellaceae bacterium]